MNERIVSQEQLDKSIAEIADAQPQAASDGALNALVIKWRRQANNMPMTWGAAGECAEELEAALAAHDQKVRETTLDGWIQIRTSFYKELLAIATEKGTNDSTA